MDSVRSHVCGHSYLHDPKVLAAQEEAIKFGAPRQAWIPCPTCLKAWDLAQKRRKKQAPVA